MRASVRTLAVTGFMGFFKRAMLAFYECGGYEKNVLDRTGNLTKPDIRAYTRVSKMETIQLDRGKNLLDYGSGFAWRFEV